MNNSLVKTISTLRHGPLRHLRSIWQPLGQLYRSAQRLTGWPRHVSKQVGPYGPFRLNGRFAFSNYESWGQGHNSGFRALIESCRPGDTVIDIGAHIGLVTLCAAAQVGPRGRIVAFEPASANLRYLRDHIAANGLTQVDVADSLVGAEERDAVEFLESKGDSGLNTRAPRALTADFVATKRRQVTLDRFCGDQQLKPNVIKIDVEGAETDVLRGAAKTIAASNPLVVLSVHPRQIVMLGSSLAELTALVKSFDYLITTPAGAPVTEFVAGGEYLLSHR